MWIVGLLVLVALGLLGIASMLRARRPDLDGPLKQLESIEGWVGVVGLVWGVIGLLQWISAIGAISVAPVTMLVALLSTLVILALSLIFALPLIKKLTGGSEATAKLAEVSVKLAPFKAALGGVCLASAAYTLVRLVV